MGLLIGQCDKKTIERCVGTLTLNPIRIKLFPEKACKNLAINPTF
jgi:hypothetical protein